MKRFETAVQRGIPIIGLRTSTHAFSGIKGDYARYNNFGKDVLGERWVSHWGVHKKEACRGIVEPGAENHPLLQGVSGVFADSDVYEAAPPADAKIIMLTGMLVGFAYITEFFMAWYGPNKAERDVFWFRAFGHYWWAFWTMFSCNVIFPLVLAVMAYKTALTRSMESATGLLYIELTLVLASTIVAAGPSVQNVSLTGAVPVGIVGDAGRWVKTAQ